MDRNCPNCGAPVELGACCCPYCGTPYQEPIKSIAEIKESLEKMQFQTKQIELNELIIAQLGKGGRK